MNVSSKAIDDYFIDMAKGKKKPHTFIINQKGRGFLSGIKGQKVYKVNQTGSGPVSIVSPVAQGYAKALSQIKGEQKLKRKRVRSRSKSASPKKRKVNKTKKKRGTSRKVNKIKKKKTVGKRKVQKKRSSKKRVRRDRFSR